MLMKAGFFTSGMDGWRRCVVIRQCPPLKAYFKALCHVWPSAMCGPLPCVALLIDDDTLFVSYQNVIKMVVKPNTLLSNGRQRCKLCQSVHPFVLNAVRPSTYRAT